MTAPKTLLRLAAAALLGVAAALLVACGGSTKGLIPAGSAGPLTEDVEAVETAAAAGGGHCGETEVALVKLKADYASLPATLDRGLHDTLRQGIDNLRTRALELCAQPLVGATQTQTTNTPTTQTTKPETTKTETTPVETVPLEPPGEEGEGESGGTPGPGEGPGGPGTGGQGNGGTEEQPANGEPAR